MHEWWSRRVVSSCSLSYVVYIWGSLIQPSELHTFYMFGASVVFVIGMAAWWAHGANDFSASLHRHQILEVTPFRATEKPVFCLGFWKKELAHVWDRELAARFVFLSLVSSFYPWQLSLGDDGVKVS